MASALNAGVPKAGTAVGGNEDVLPYRNCAIAKPLAAAGAVTVTLVMGVVVDAANSSAPLEPTTLCEIVPRVVPPLK